MRRFARRSYAAMEEIAILCISGRLGTLGWNSRGCECADMNRGTISQIVL
jgi:hypothetical protein